MSASSCKTWSIRVAFAVIVAGLLTLSTTALTFASGTTQKRLSTDPYTNSTSQHKAQVEPDTFSYGSTIVSSTDGGSSWKAAVTVATIDDFFEPSSIRTGPLPSAEIDGSGTVYVAWHDCRFESGCSANDIVYSTSTNGTSWSAVKRVPADPVGSGVDHFIPGIAVDKSTSGSTAHLAVTYYYFTDANCTSNCQLDVGYLSSTNGGSTWSASQQLAGPIMLSWLPNTTLGNMVGDYISTSIAGNGNAFPVFAVAKAPQGSVLNESMHTVKGGLPVVAGTLSSGAVVLDWGHHAPAISRHTAL